MRRVIAVLVLVLGACAEDGRDGAQGLVGPQGVRGVVGATGSTGATGPVGPTGSAGDDGAAGAQGLAGATGPKGATGSTGPTGAAGVQGSQGVPGSQGPVGATGATGPAGSGLTKASLYVVTHPETVPGLSEGTSTAACLDASDVLLSGGCDGLLNVMRVYHFQANNFATAGVASSWMCYGYNPSGGPISLTAHAYCLAVP